MLTKARLLAITLVLLTIPLIALNAQDDPAPDDLPAEIIVNQRNLQPEGIAWDATRDRFLSGSLSVGTVFAIDDDGTVAPVIEDDDFMVTVGIHIDDERNRLLVPIGNAVVFFAPAPPPQALVAAYDLETGERLFLTDLTDVYPDANRNFPNDLTVDADGNTYITDSFAPVVYRVTPDGEASVFVEDDRLAAEFLGLNGIDYHPDGYLLVANAGERQVFKVPLDDPTALSEVELPTPISIDGMTFDDDLNLIAVARIPVEGEDEPVQQVVRLTSDDDWESADITGAVETGGEATTVTMRDGVPYYVNAYLNNIFQSQYEIVRVDFDDDMDED